MLKYLFLLFLFLYIVIAVLNLFIDWLIKYRFFSINYKIKLTNSLKNNFQKLNKIIFNQIIFYGCWTSFLFFLMELKVKKEVKNWLKLITYSWKLSFLNLRLKINFIFSLLKYFNWNDTLSAHWTVNLVNAQL